MYPVKISGARTVLREFRIEDVDDTQAIVGDTAVTEPLAVGHRTREQTISMVRNAIEHGHNESRIDYFLAVALPTDDRVIGFVRIKFGDAQAGKLSCAIRADLWRRGYATDACTAMLTLAFDELGLYRISAAIGPDNTATLAAVQQLGFIYEGRIRDHVHINGVWRDSLLYSILQAEWNKRAEVDHPH